jgi:hypothetical protein
MGSGVRLRGNITSTRGDHGCIFHGFVPAGHEEIHGNTRSAIQIPVRSGTAGGGGQTNPHVGLDEGTFGSGLSGSGMAFGPQDRQNE